MRIGLLSDIYANLPALEAVLAELARLRRRLEEMTGWAIDDDALRRMVDVLRHLVAAAIAAEQVLGLVDQGITEFHFYTLNRADLVYAICHLNVQETRKVPGKPLVGFQPDSMTG